MSVVYGSSASTKLSDGELRALLDAARRNNQAHDISGILAYWDGNFIQYIEGPVGEIDQLLRNLGRDRRHDGRIVLQREEISGRAFPDCSMASDRKSDGYQRRVSSIWDFHSDGFLHADPGVFSPAARLLPDMFRQHIR